MAWGRNPVRRVLSDEDERRVVAAIRKAEGMTSGEIRVHVEARCGGDPLAAARRWFQRLAMHETAERNGILIYVAAAERAFAVLGDSGIHERVGASFWEAVRDAMTDEFKKGAFAAGLIRAIETVGERLAEHFPHRSDDRNELPDGVSRS